MTRVFIIHGWEGSPGINWFPWLKHELEKQGIEVHVPQMPNPDNPVMQEWVNHLSETVRSPDDKCYLIGHSLGCITILRYLEGLAPGKSIGGAVLVAGFTDDLGYKELANFFTLPIDFGKIKSHCVRFVAINSDNDPYVPLRHAGALTAGLGAELIVLHGKGHMNTSDGVTELPVVLRELGNMFRQ